MADPIQDTMEAFRLLADQKVALEERLSRALAILGPYRTQSQASESPQVPPTQKPPQAVVPPAA